MSPMGRALLPAGQRRLAGMLRIAVGGGPAGRRPSRSAASAAQFGQEPSFANGGFQDVARCCNRGSLRDERLFHSTVGSGYIARRRNNCEL